jgi:hypothetical protein
MNCGRGNRKAVHRDMHHNIEFLNYSVLMRLYVSQNVAVIVLSPMIDPAPQKLNILQRWTAISLTSRPLR